MYGLIIVSYMKMLHAPLLWYVLVSGVLFMKISKLGQVGLAQGKLVSVVPLTPQYPGICHVALYNQ